MDCEKFDNILMDALYDELDELTLAAARRHADACQRCHAAWTGLRATRKVGVLPIVEAPASLEPGILQAAREAHGNIPWPKRVGRAVSWAGSYAMRPQTAMAAILLLMLGSSVIFVRVKPERSGAPSRVSVTERGVPEQAAEDLRPEKVGMPRERPVVLGRSSRRDEEHAPPSSGPFAASPGAPAARELSANESFAAEGRAVKGADRADPLGEPFAPRAKNAGAPSDDLAAGSAGDQVAEKKKDESRSGAGSLAARGTSPKDAYGAAMDLYTAGRFSEAEKAFEEASQSGARNAASAALHSAKSAEAAYGCSKAASKYEVAAVRYAGSSPGAEALWGAANCYKVLGNLERASVLYKELRSVAGYRDRAEGELENLKILQQQVAARGSRAQPAKPAAPAAPPAATAVPSRSASDRGAQ